MKISAQISYFPLAEPKFREIIINVIQNLVSAKIDLEYTSMSTVLIGEHTLILKLIQNLIEQVFSKHQSILDVKFSNACELSTCNTKKFDSRT